MTEQNLWHQILKDAERRMNPYLFHTWFHPTQFESFDGTTLIVKVPDKHFEQKLSDHWQPLLQACFQATGRPDLKVSYIWAP
jgi:chromosomal replication initiation ATPase DnaA